MLGSFMRYRIGSYVKSCLIITTQLHLLKISNIQFLKKLFNPNKFASDYSHSLAFSFSTRMSYDILLFTFPRDNISIKKDTISQSKLFINRKTCPICITIANYLRAPFIFIEYFFPRSLLNVSLFSSMHPNGLCKGIIENCNYKRNIYLIIMKQISFPTNFQYLSRSQYEPPDSIVA